MTSRISWVAIVMVVATLAGCAADEPESVRPVASKACGLISDNALREITGRTEFYEGGSDGYSYYELGPEGYVPSEDKSSLNCSARSTKKVDGFRAPYVYIAAGNMDQVRQIRRALNSKARPGETKRRIKLRIRQMRRDRSCSRLVTFPDRTGFICDEKAGRQLTNAFVVPNDRRQVAFFFYPSIDQSVATPENVLRWAKDVDRTIAKRDKIAAEQAENDSKD